MKLLKSIFALMLVVVMLITSVPFITAFAASGKVYTDGNTGFTYKVLSEADKTCEITEAVSRTVALVIPERLSVYKVVSIGENAFYKTSYTKITIPATVKKIGAYAFKRCENLKTIVFKEGLTHIGVGAFANSGVTSVALPKSLKVLGDYAFNHCENLGKVVIKNVSTLGDYVFSYAGVTSVTLPSNLKCIPVSMFDNCSLLSIKIPDTVESIGRDAFNGCSLTSVKIPASVKRIEDGAFKMCNLTGTVVVPGTVKFVSLDAFSYNNNLQRIILENGVEEIYWDGGMCCDSLKTISVPDSVHTVTITTSFSSHVDQDKIHANPGTAAADSFIIESNHTYTSTVVAPTCVEGYTLFSCECGYSYKDDFTPPVEEHEIINISYKKATTKAPGCTQGSYCSKCNTVFEESKKIPQIGGVTLNYTEFKYTGKVRKPTVTVKDKAGKKISSANYTVSIPESKKMGTYTVKVTFKGNYSGTLSAKYKIVPPPTTLSSFERYSSAIKVKWKAQTSNTTGYQIQYGKKKDLSDGKIVWITNNKTTERTIKKLSNAKYYFRLRTYKLITKNGAKTRYYSPWTNINMVYATNTTTMKVLNHWEKTWITGSSTKLNTYQSADSTSVNVHAILKRDAYRDYKIYKIYLYRSTSKNGTYKHIKTFNGDKLYGEGFLRLNYYDENVKPNTAYYYKIKLFYVPTFYDSSISLGALLPEQKIYDYISTTGAYRTAPKAQRNLRTTGSWLSWSKVSGVNGYVVNEDAMEVQGYNIYGQPVYGTDEYEYVSTSVGCRSKLYSRLREPGDTHIRYYVRPYKKVGDYYYCDGFKVTKSLNVRGYEGGVHVGG